MICTTVRHDIGWINLCGLSLQWDEILEGETNKISLIFLAYLFSSLWIKKYGIWICQIDFAFAGLSVLKHSTKEKGILSYVLHTILWFHKKVQYGGDGYVLATELLGEENFLSQIGHHPSQIFNSGAEARGSQSCKQKVLQILRLYNGKKTLFFACFSLTSDNLTTI